MKLPIFCSMARNVNSATAPHALQRSAPCSFTPIIMVPGSPAPAPVLLTCSASPQLSHGGSACRRSVKGTFTCAEHACCKRGSLPGARLALRSTYTIVRAARTKLAMPAAAGSEPVPEQSPTRHHCTHYAGQKGPNQGS